MTGKRKVVSNKGKDATSLKRKVVSNKGKDATSLPQIELPLSITVKQLSDILSIEPAKVIKQLMRKGIMANINQILDFDVASMVAGDFGYLAQQEVERKTLPTRKIEAGDRLQLRPPVVTIMGHVDHGKTTLLDAIRKTNVAARETGEITQHIGAYQTKANGRKITFVDTPGHEAFTAMRAHGAQVTDIVILVVAADDGIMPQTVEAMNHAKAAGVPIVVAINKMDKPEADPERVKRQLADLGLIVEEWGGDTICVPVSAKKEQGISDLLENLFLVADIRELKADPNCVAEGIVLEARLDKNKGPLATLLIQKGTLRIGDVVVAGNVWGKVKAMFDDEGNQIRKGEPSTPIAVMGINGIPKAGDIFISVDNEHQARNMVEKQKTKVAHTPLNLSTLSRQISAGQVKELNIVLKVDVEGSIEPIKSSLEQLENEQVKVRILHSGSGTITESDVMLAIASGGIIIGFNTRPEPGVKRLAEAAGIEIRHYNVIYNLVEDMGKAVAGLFEPVYVDVIEGHAQVRDIFNVRQGKVAGAYVTDGKIGRSALARVLRNGQMVHESSISSLKHFKENVSEMAAGLECGIGIEGFSDFQLNDVIEAYGRERE